VEQTLVTELQWNRHLIHAGPPLATLKTVFSVTEVTLKTVFSVTEVTLKTVFSVTEVTLVVTVIVIIFTNSVIQMHFFVHFFLDD
jgi:hypothetical protein